MIFQDLLLYLLQLVQALKYENFEEIKQGSDVYPPQRELAPSPEPSEKPVEKQRYFRHLTLFSFVIKLINTKAQYIKYFFYVSDT